MCVFVCVKSLEPSDNFPQTHIHIGTFLRLEIGYNRHINIHTHTHTKEGRDEMLQENSKEAQ